MIESASPPSPNISNRHSSTPSHSSSSHLRRPANHEKRHRSQSKSRGSAAGSAMQTMKSEDLKAQGSPRKSSTPAKRTSSEQQSPEDRPIHSSDLSGVRATPLNRPPSTRYEEQGDNGEGTTAESQAKRTKSNDGPKVVPLEYEHCSVSDLVQVICEMLMDLIRINDPLPLQDGGLTRFHSRIPPAISILDYLHRLATHATLSPPILLSMVYYIDKLCALYPAFTISSLTVHRFLIASATVASKGLRDAFWTNGTYARVGGVSIRELALLELELLWRIDWRIVPQPEVLTEYYKSLVTRSDGFKLERPAEPMARPTKSVAP